MRKNVNFPKPELARKIQDRANREGRSFSGMVNRICDLFFRQISQEDAYGEDTDRS